MNTPEDYVLYSILKAAINHSFSLNQPADLQVLPILLFINTYNSSTHNK